MKTAGEIALTVFLAYSCALYLYGFLIYPALQRKCTFELHRISDEIYFHALEPTLGRVKDFPALKAHLALNKILGNIYLRKSEFEVSGGPAAFAAEDFISLMNSENKEVRVFSRQLARNMLAWYFAEKPFRGIFYGLVKPISLFSDRVRLELERSERRPIDTALNAC